MRGQRASNEVRNVAAGIEQETFKNQSGPKRAEGYPVSNRSEHFLDGAEIDDFDHAAFRRESYWKGWGRASREPQV